MQYSYIYLNFGIENRKNIDMSCYGNFCLSDLINKKDITILFYPLQKKCQFVKNLYAIHNSKLINKYINLRFKSIWNPFIIDKSLLKTNKTLCFVFTGYNFSVAYVKYIKKKYPMSKLVYVCRDRIELYKKRTPDVMNEALDSNLFDIVYSYDIKDSEKYNLCYFNEISSKMDIVKDVNYPLSDVFFAGVVKDRLKILYEVYYHLTQFGIKCNYYLVGVPKESQIKLDGIEYSDRQLSYREMVYRSVNSRCILEVNQENAYGYTSRCLEAITYNKKLLTNNKAVKQLKFFNEEYIKYFENASEIDPKFIMENKQVDYHYNDEFSPIKLIQKIDEDLSNISI